MPKVSASILNSNNAFLGESIKAAERGGADFIHIDIMDGVYVDNFTFGPKTISDIKQITNVPIEVHLELYHPNRFIEMFAQAGADIIIVQLDCCVNPIRTLNQIKQHDKKAGLAINPVNRIKDLEYLAHHLDYLILMSVEPGFGGQKFEDMVYDKITKTKALFDSLDLQIPIAVDGGINLEIAKEVIKRGADILTVGSSIFKNGDIQENVAKFKNII